MANEATIRTSLFIRKGKLTYQGQPTSFQANVDGSGGPTPGAVLVGTGGTDIDLSALTTPGLCRIMNLDPTNYVEYGIWDSVDGLFFPLGEILPGESYVLRLSRNLGEDYVGVGTGTSAAVHTLRCKANTASCVVLVEAFEK